jgi:hypothetical protein
MLLEGCVRQQGCWGMLEGGQEEEEEEEASA